MDTATKRLTNEPHDRLQVAILRGHLLTFDIESNLTALYKAYQKNGVFKIGPITSVTQNAVIKHIITELFDEEPFYVTLNWKNDFLHLGEHRREKIRFYLLHERIPIFWRSPIWTLVELSKENLRKPLLKVLGVINSVICHELFAY